MISVLRDISERGRELEQVLHQYITFVKPAFEEFCLPVRNFHKLSSLLGFISVKIFSEKLMLEEQCRPSLQPFVCSSRQKSMQMW